MFRDILAYRTHIANLFLSQSHKLDPATTLYVVFFGINDFLASQGRQGLSSILRSLKPFFYASGR